MSKRQTRKRRSFYQPESDVLTEWLDAQQNLGRSLQLVIVDAIRKYGNGDVVTAFLEQRERELDAGESAAENVPKKPTVTESKEKPKPKKKPVTKKVAPKPAEKEKDDNDDYDPIEVMMNDIGSRMTR